MVKRLSPHILLTGAEKYLESRRDAGFPLLSQTPINNFQPLKTEEPKTAKVHSTTQKETEDFLLEIGSEELPASFVSIGLQGLESKIKTLLDHSGLTYSSIQCMGTPRRLTIIGKIQT